MKTIAPLIAALALIVATGSAKAQTISDFKKMTDKQKAQFITDSLKANLNLTKPQYDKVFTETLAGIQKVSPVMKADASKMEKRQQMRAFLTEEETRLKAILTPEQYILFETKKQKAIAYYMQHMQQEKIVFNVPQ